MQFWPILRQLDWSECGLGYFYHDIIFLVFLQFPRIQLCTDTVAAHLKTKLKLMCFIFRVQMCWNCCRNLFFLSSSQISFLISLFEARSKSVLRLYYCVWRAQKGGSNDVTSSFVFPKCIIMHGGLFWSLWAADRWWCSHVKSEISV